jgi:hypothetical protein
MNWCVYDTYSKHFAFFSSYDEAWEEYNKAVSTLETNAEETATIYIFEVINEEEIIK